MGIVAATEYVQKLSLYRLALKYVEYRQQPVGRRSVLRRTQPRGDDHQVLVAGRRDAASVYVGTWLCLLLILLAFTPRVSAGQWGLAVLSVLVLAAATARYLDLTTYQIGILLDPRQRRLQGAERSLVLLALNLVEVTLIGGIWLFAGSYSASGRPAGRTESWLHAVNLVGTLSPVSNGSVLVVCAQLATLVAGLLLLIASIGVFISLIGAGFNRG